MPQHHFARFGCIALLAGGCLGWPVATLADPAAAAAVAESDAQQLLAAVGLHESPVAQREVPGWHAPHMIVARRVRPDTVQWLQGLAPGARVSAVSTSEEAMKIIGDADVLLGFCEKDLIDAGKQLRWVQSFAAGVEHCVGAPSIQSGKVLLTNTQRVSGPVIAEYVVGVLLTLARGLPHFMTEQHNAHWDQSFAVQGNTRSMRGKTLLVVGLGGLGTEVARFASALGMKVIATRNTSREAPPFVSYVGLADELPALAQQADAIVSTMPLTAATTGIFNAKFFSSLKRTAYFVNVGRGASVVTADLDAALRSGAIAGAAIDVTEPEPLPADNPLWRAPNLIITPHVSAVADTGNQTMVAVVEENLRRYVHGDRMLSVVQPGRGY